MSNIIRKIIILTIIAVNVSFAYADYLANASIFLTATVIPAPSFTLRSNWNLISIAASPANDSIQSIFQGIHISPNIWIWDNNQFRRADTIEPLRGHWVFYHGSNTTQVFLKNIIPESSPATYDIALQSGWNLISINRVPENNSVRSIFANVNISPVAWTWVDNQFITADKLESFRGYWVYLHGPNESIHINADSE